MIRSNKSGALYKYVRRGDNYFVLNDEGELIVGIYAQVPKGYTLKWDDMQLEDRSRALAPGEYRIIFPNLCDAEDFIREWLP